MKYATAAAALGVGWFVVLLVPTLTREWLLGDPLVNLACLVAASVVMARVFHGFVHSAESLAAHFVRGALLPYLGCLVYLALCAAVMAARGALGGEGIDAHDTLALFASGFTAAAVSFFVVVPYGLFCQYVMKAVSERVGG